jgi:putative transposase
MKTQGNLRYTIYECKYQIVFIHKYHQRVLFAALRQAFGNVFHELFRQKESPIVEG